MTTSRPLLSCFLPHILLNAGALSAPFSPTSFHIKLMPASNDSNPTQHYSPSKPPSSFAGPATNLLSRHPPSAYQTRPMTVHSGPYQATLFKGILPQWDTSRSVLPLSRTNNSTSPADISKFSHRLGYTCTPPERRSEVHELRMSSSAGLSKASSSGQCQLTFSRLILPSEKTSERLSTRHVETAAIEELDNIHLVLQS